MSEDKKLAEVFVKITYDYSFFEFETPFNEGGLVRAISSLKGIESVDESPLENIMRHLKFIRKEINRLEDGDE